MRLFESTDPLTVNLAQLAPDGNRSAQLKMVEALKEQNWTSAKSQLWKAHNFAPGDPGVFELLIPSMPPKGAEGSEEQKLHAAATRLLGKTRGLWTAAKERLPNSPLCQKQLRRCSLALEKLGK